MKLLSGWAVSTPNCMSPGSSIESHLKAELSISLHGALLHNLQRLIWAYIVCSGCLSQNLNMIRGFVKEECLVIIMGQFSPVLHKNICCGYSFEVSHWGTSNEYPQRMFLWRNKKNYPRIITKYSLTLVLLNPDIPCLCKQCSSRSVGFWRSQLIWICTICHWVCEFTCQQPRSSNRTGWKLEVGTAS